MNEGLTTVVLILTLADANHDYHSQLDLVKKSMPQVSENWKLIRKALRYFQEKIISIEIVNKDKELQRIYFAKPPLQMYHSEFSKKSFELAVNRNSANDKIEGLMNHIKFIDIEVNHFASLRRRGLWANLSAFHYLKLISFFLAVIINVALFVLSPNINDERVRSAPFGTWNEMNIQEKVIKYSTFILLFFYVATLILWIIFQFNIHLKTFLLEDIKRQSIYTNRSFLSGVKRFFRICYRFVYDTYLISLVFYILMTVLGLTVSKMYLSLLIIDIIEVNPVLRTVVNALSRNISQFLMTGLLGLVIVFIFSAFTYYNSHLRNSLKFIEDPELDMCHNYFNCFFSMINFGLRSGGGIGDALRYPNYSDDITEYIYRTVFDFWFFVLIVLIFLNIILGIIVDSFAEVRDMKNKRGTFYLIN